jgi:hypothetical protein
MEINCHETIHKKKFPKILIPDDLQNSWKKVKKKKKGGGGGGVDIDKFS